MTWKMRKSSQSKGGQDKFLGKKKEKAFSKSVEPEGTTTLENYLAISCRVKYTVCLYAKSLQSCSNLCDPYGP